MSLWGLGCNSLWTQVGTLPLEPSSLPPGHNVFVNDTVRESGDGLVMLVMIVRIVRKH